MNPFEPLTAEDVRLLLQLFANLALCVFLASVLKLHYVKFGRSLANRSAFAANFLVVSLAVTLIIAIVKGSLTLSLGLVGALSIVRFRTPVKDPEELSYLFLAVAIGIGLGANQPVLTTAALLTILAVLSLRSRLSAGGDPPGTLYLEVDLPGEGKGALTRLTELLEGAAGPARLRRLDAEGETLQAGFNLQCEAGKLAEVTAALQDEWAAARVTLLDQSVALDA
jgi:hypothetical protein